jgi:hypothetical protein
LCVDSGKDVSEIRIDVSDSSGLFGSGILGAYSPVSAQIGGAGSR